MSNAFCDGEPKVIDSYQEYEGKDENISLEHKNLKSGIPGGTPG